MAQANVGLRANSGERSNTVPIHVTPQFYLHLAHALPILVNEELQVLRMLPNAFEIFVDETLQGEERLTFRLPHETIPELRAEAVVELAGRVYRIITIDSLDTDAGRILEVDAWARWQDLSKGVWLTGRTWNNATAAEMVGWMLFLTPWRVGVSTVTGLRSLHWEGGCNRLEALRQVEEIFSAELVWDTAARTVSIIPAGGVDQGLYFLRGRNLRKMDIETTTADTVYRLYARGQGGITFAPVNHGRDYIEIPAPINPPPSAMLEDDRFTDSVALLEYANAIFATMNTPRISYQCEIIDISALPDAAEQQIALGDVVNVYDEDTDTHLKTRVVKLRYNVEEPWNSAIELSTVAKDMGTIISDLQRNLFDRDRRQLAPFNTLLQSVDFYTDGMVTMYEDQTRYIWLFTRDGAGRIRKLTNTAYGTDIDIRHFTTEVPTA